MQGARKRINRQREYGGVAHTIGVLGLVLLAGMGIALESSSGWITNPPLITGTGGQRCRHRGFVGRVGWAWMRRSWITTAMRSEGLMAFVFMTGQEEWKWVILLPWVVWLWQGLGVAWPGLGRQPLYRMMGQGWKEASRLAMMGLGLLWLTQQLAELKAHSSYGLPGMGIGSVVNKPLIEVERDAEGMYHVRFSGEFELHVNGKVMFYVRMLAIFLGSLEVAGESRGGRRTRDGRTPYVQQEMLAKWFGVPQSNISRWFKYWLNQDWRRLLSQKAGEVLTMEVQQRVIDFWTQFPWWGAQRVWEHLKKQGECITLEQVRQAGRESGWYRLRAALRRVYVISAESFRPRDEWLVSQLLAQIQQMIGQLEKVGGVTPEQQMTWADLKALWEELELCPAVTRRPLPWVLRLERVLFGH